MIYTQGTTLGFTQLGPALDGTGSQSLGTLTSQQQLRNPSIVGDLLYVQQGACGHGNGEALREVDALREPRARARLVGDGHRRRVGDVHRRRAADRDRRQRRE